MRPKLQPNWPPDLSSRIRLGEIAAQLNEEYKRHGQLNAKGKNRTSVENDEMKNINTRVNVLEKEWRDLAPSIGEAMAQGRIIASYK